LPAEAATPENYGEQADEAANSAQEMMARLLLKLKPLPLKLLLLLLLLWRHR
jgi:hypothetical protein